MSCGIYVIVKSSEENGSIAMNPLVRSSQSLASKHGEHKRSLMDLLAVILAMLLLFLRSPGTEGLLKVAVGVLAANHETDLARGVRWNRGIRVLDVGENLLARLLQRSNEGHMKPLILGYNNRNRLA